MVVYLQPFVLFLQYFNQNSESVIGFVIGYHHLSRFFKYWGRIGATTL